MSKNRNTLNNHKKEGKRLIPPLRQIPNLSYYSWTDRLPEYLYVALLVANLSQEEYLRIFRLIVAYFVEIDKRPRDLSHSALCECNAELLLGLLNDIFNAEKFKRIFRPLLLFKKIPCYSVWKEFIGTETNPNEDWEMLQKAIGETLNSRSQESVDIMWLSIVYKMVSGRLRFRKKKEHEEIMDMVLNYPCKGDLEEVNSIIRSMYGACEAMEKSIWARSFWDACLLKTPPIIPLPKVAIKQEKIDETLVSRLKSTWKKLFYYFYETLETSVDAKHDVVFGIVMYSMQILTDSFNRNIGTYLIGRIVLRSLVENYITLSYLAKKDKPELWKKFKEYGAGQAKLISLKTEKYESVPQFFNLKDINEIMEEERRKELVDIDLGNWASINLRKMSEESGTKGIYDKYYDLTSAYLHGNWAAIRDSIFVTDFNPLHRLMRVPIPKRNFEDVIPDMVKIMNLQLSLLSKIYGIDDLRI